jgi:mannose-1-phosphate guanylyltransferase
MATAPGDFPWSDVGDFDSLAQLVPGGSVRAPGAPEPVLTDAPGAIVINETDQRVVVLGVEDAVVAVADGVILVTKRSQAQRVKDLADGSKV